MTVLHRFARYILTMTRFTGIAFAIALACGCAAKSKEEARNGSPNTGPRATERGGGATQDTTGGGGNPAVTATPTPDQATGHETPPGGPDIHQGQQTTDGKGHQAGDGAAKPLDPSVGADPNSPKQQARTTGLLGATDNFDDSPVDLQLDTPDDAIKTLLAADKAKLTACHKTGGGTLEITLTVDATGKVTAVKIAATSTLKDTAARTCVVALVKKLKLEKGSKPTAPIKITFPK